MPKLYTPTDTAVFNNEPPLTEQEHRDSCDINKMIRGALRGMTMNGSASQPQFGYDDTTLDGVTHRINLQKAQQEMQRISETQEFTAEELKHIPESIKQKYKFKKAQNETKSKQNDQASNTTSTTTSTLATPSTPVTPS